MVQTVLITGCSSGFGRAAALRLRQAGWNVVATMRDPDHWRDQDTSGGLLVTRLDVRDNASIEAAIMEGSERFGRIDCVVNNAGVGLFSVFEVTPMATIGSVFDANVFGAMRVMQVALPHFRANAGGRFINVTSAAAIVPEPLMAAYAASKAALDAFTEAVRFELQGQGIVVKLVEPGFVPGTQFVQQTQAAAQAVPVPPSYQPYVDQRAAAYKDELPFELATEDDVAGAILAAATDATGRLRFMVGPDTELSARMRFETSEEEYSAWTQGRFAPARL